MKQRGGIHIDIVQGRARHNPHRRYRRNPGGGSLVPWLLIGGAALLLLRPGGVSLPFLQGGVWGRDLNSPTPPPGTVIPPGMTWVQGKGVVSTADALLLKAGVPIATSLATAAATGLVGWIKDWWSSTSITPETPTSMPTADILGGVYEPPAEYVDPFAGVAEPATPEMMVAFAQPEILSGAPYDYYGTASYGGNIFDVLEG